MFSKKANASFVVPYATKDIIINIRINLKIVIKVCNFEMATFFIKSADTCAFKKKALGIARKATSAIPNSTISIVPATGELRKRLPNTSQKVSIANEN